jgi:DNA-binding XRE family transcriptional regulator
MLLKKIILIISCFVCQGVLANPSDMARCVNATDKASALMTQIGNTTQAANFKKYVEGMSLAGKKLYGAQVFAKELANTKKSINSISNEQLVEMMPKCIEIANNFNANMASITGIANPKIVIPFKVVNQSSQQVHEIYSSPSSSDKWGSDLLGNQYIEIGDDYTLSPNIKDVCMQDIRVVFKDKSEFESTRKDLCESQSFTLTDNSRKQKNQNQTVSPSRTYCAVSTMGGPPVGCGLTFQQCQNAVRGISGMMCR